MSLLRELQRRNVIRVATAYIVSAWLVIQVFETIFPAFGFTDRAIRIVVIAVAIAFVPVVIGAWFFEWTPQGLQRDEDAREVEIERSETRNFDRAIVVVLMLGIVYFAVDKFVLAPERAAVREVEIAEEAKEEALKGFYGDRSIAVVPFDNMSSDPEQQFFADGIAEEVLNLLARIRDLRVISRSSAFALRDLNLDVPEMAERLDVAHILEGSVRKMGNTVRVTAQLIEARSDTHLWSKVYTKELENAFQIQDEIAADVVANLQIKLLKPLPRSSYVDPEVRSLVKQAWQLEQARQEGVGMKMHALLSRALEIDPDYLPALNLMPAAYFHRWREDLTEEEVFASIDEVRARVRELDPNDGTLLAWDAWQKAVAGEFEEAAALYSRSFSTDLTNSNNIRLAGYFARQIDRQATAARLGRHSVAIDPLCHQCRRRYAESLMYVGDYEQARKEQERFMASATGGEHDYLRILLLDSEPQQALDFIEALGRESIGDWMRLAMTQFEAMARYSLGETGRAEQLLAELIASDYHDKRSVSFSVAETAAWMGKNDLAFDRLFEMQATNFQYLRRRIFSPTWRNLHDDPRWLEFREAYGLSPERLDAIEFDPNLPE